MEESTLGFLETYGFIGAIEGLDVALKAADVQLVSCEFVTAGIVTIVITGDVASVKAAIEAACIAIDRVGTLRNAHVIARAQREVWNILNREDKSNLSSDNKIKCEKVIDEKVTDEKTNNKIKKTRENTPKVQKDSLKIEQILKMSKEELELLKVQELRTIARTLKEQEKFSLTRKQIKFSKKEQLIKAILSEQ